MFKKDSATESRWEVASADAAVPSWTHSWNMQKPAGLPKRRNHFSADGNTRSKSLFHGREQPWHKQFCQIHRHGQNGSSLVSLKKPCVTGDMSLLLDGGPGHHDHADSETDTAIPDDDDDIASVASCSIESLQPSSL